MGTRRTGERARDRGGSRSFLRGAAAVLVVGLLLALGAAGPADAAECPNEELRSEKSAALPDCRAYEQVSPSVKGVGIGQFNGRLFPEPFVSIASQARDGSVVFGAHEPLPGSASGTLTNLYLTNRGEHGWVIRPIVPPASPLPGSTPTPVYYATSSDLSKSILETSNPILAPGAKPDLLNTYLEDNETGRYELVTTGQGQEGERGFTVFAGASTDFSHVAFGYSARLLPEAPGNTAVYEFVDGKLRLASILPNGEPAVSAQPVGASSERGFQGVSDDGSHVYFSADSELLVRIDGDQTHRVDASQRAVPVFENALASTFWAASSNGNLSFFTSRLPLTEDANTGRDPEGNYILTGNDLYMYDLSDERLTDLSADTSPLDVETGAEVQGVVGASEDGSYVYFVALGKLDEGAAKGLPNLYVWHDGAVKYLATLSPADSGNWAQGLNSITSRVSPDGRHVLLTSVAPLTGYDNTDVTTGEPDSEIYLYSADTPSFECVSCNPDGSRPRTSTSIFTILYNTTVELPNFMTDDGTRVAFETSEALLRRDTNGQPDIYEFSHGKVALVSTGTDDRRSGLGEMSRDGKDLYFTTFERLTPSDIDNYADLYDAREGGGFVETTQTVAPCVGIECSRGTSARPSPPNVGSARFGGPRNQTRKPKRPRCGPKKRVIKRGKGYKCVAKSSKEATKNGKRRRRAGSSKGGSK